MNPPRVALWMTRPPASGSSRSATRVPPAPQARRQPDPVEGRPEGRFVPDALLGPVAGVRRERGQQAAVDPARIEDATVRNHEDVLPERMRGAMLGHRREVRLIAGGQERRRHRLDRLLRLGRGGRLPLHRSRRLFGGRRRPLDGGRRLIRRRPRLQHRPVGSSADERSTTTAPSAARPRWTPRCFTMTKRCLSMSPPSKTTRIDLRPHPHVFLNLPRPRLAA